MASFKIFRQFNDPELRPLAGLRARLDERAADVFASQSLPDKLARALATRRALPVKELIESFEFFARVRRRVRAPRVADLCCGHGLTGALFAVFERDVEEVMLLDKRRPANHDAVMDALMEVAPWAPAKLRFVEDRVEVASAHMARGTSVVGVHACGVRTDRCLDAALAHGSAIAVMPCCYGRTALDGPRALREALGAEVATDVHRTYRLEAAGYRVDWSAVPEVITGMHRILIGVPSP